MKILTRLLKGVPVVNLGFYSGMLSGLFLGLTLATAIAVFGFEHLPDIVAQYFFQYFELLGIFYGCAFVLVFLIGYASHILRRRYGFICGCTASAFLASGEDEEVQV